MHFQSVGMGGSLSLWTAELMRHNCFPRIRRHTNFPKRLIVRSWKNTSSQGLVHICLVSFKLCQTWCWVWWNFHLTRANILTVPQIKPLNTGINKNSPSKTFRHFITVIELGWEITHLVVKNSNNIFTHKFSSDTDFLLPSSKAITEKHYC